MVLANIKIPTNNVESNFGGIFIEGCPIAQINNNYFLFETNHDKLQLLSTTNNKHFDVVRNYGNALFSYSCLIKPNYKIIENDQYFIDIAYNSSIQSNVLSIIDINDYEQINYVEFNYPVSCFTIQDNYLFISNYTDSVIQFNITNPYQPILMQSWIVNDLNYFRVKGDYFYGISNSSLLQIYNINTLVNATWNAAELKIHNFYIEGDKLYFVDVHNEDGELFDYHDLGLYVLDITNPLTPIVISNLSIPTEKIYYYSTPIDILVHKDIVYLAYENDILIYDVSDLSAIAKITSFTKSFYNYPGSFCRMFLAENCVYITFQKSSGGNIRTDYTFLAFNITENGKFKLLYPRIFFYREWLPNLALFFAYFWPFIVPVVVVIIVIIVVVVIYIKKQKKAKQQKGKELVD